MLLGGRLSLHFGPFRVVRERLIASNGPSIYAPEPFIAQNGALILVPERCRELFGPFIYHPEPSICARERLIAQRTPGGCRRHPYGFVKGYVGGRAGWGFPKLWPWRELEGWHAMVAQLS